MAHRARRIDVTVRASAFVNGSHHGVPESAPQNDQPFSYVSVTTADGVRLGATHFQPVGPLRGAVVISSAMAVRQKLYKYFALHLAEAGLATLTFDYRGIDRSLQGSVQQLSGASATDWGVHDLGAAFRSMAERHAGVPLLHVGHSIGGQLLGLCPEAARIRASLLIASQSGYWGHWHGTAKWLMRSYWAVMEPVSRIIGYLPMETFQQGENVPLGVALEWKRWAMEPQYVLTSERAKADRGYERLAVPMRAYSISDDAYAPRRATEALLQMYSSCRSELLDVRPADLGVNRIGHFDIFKREFADSFWPKARDWLLAQT